MGDERCPAVRRALVSLFVIYVALIYFLFTPLGS